MPHFLYHLTLNPSHYDMESWSPEDQAALRGHVAFLDGLGKDGHLVFAGRTDMPPGDPMLFGIALIRAESLEEAQE